MYDIFWVFLANAAVWLGLGGCLVCLCRAQAKLTRRLDKIIPEHNQEPPCV